MRNLWFPFMLFLALWGQAQENPEVVEWASDYKITLADFQSPATQIHPKLPGSSMQPGITLGFNLQMNAAAFMLTRNFNPKVSCTLQPSAAFLTATDSTQAEGMVALARLQFDLTEVYARKLRKALHENKKTFSDASFFQPYFQKLQAELNAESSRITDATQMGQDREVLAAEHQKIREAMELLSDYCKSCKPPRKSSGP